MIETSEARARSKATGFAVVRKLTEPRPSLGIPRRIGRIGSTSKGGGFGSINGATRHRVCRDGDGLEIFPVDEMSVVGSGKLEVMAMRTASRPGRRGKGLGHQAETVVQSGVGPPEVEPLLTIVIPAKNEAQNLPDVLARLPQGCELILVDGKSTDDTVSVAQSLRPDIAVIHQTREGKGNALACGFDAAKGDFIIMIDADGSNDPLEIPRFVDALKRGADFAKGSRFVEGGGSQDITLIRRLGNFWLNKIVNFLYGTRYTDLCYGYNAFRRECLKVMQLPSVDLVSSEPGALLWGDGFEVETLINVRIAKAGLKVTEVPSFEAARNFGVSNLNAFSDGIRVLRTIQAERQRSARRAAKRAARSKPEAPIANLGEDLG